MRKGRLLLTTSFIVGFLFRSSSTTAKRLPAAATAFLHQSTRPFLPAPAHVHQTAAAAAAAGLTTPLIVVTAPRASFLRSFSLQPGAADEEDFVEPGEFAIAEDELDKETKQSSSDMARTQNAGRMTTEGAGGGGGRGKKGAGAGEGGAGPSTKKKGSTTKSTKTTTTKGKGGGTPQGRRSGRAKGGEIGAGQRGKNAEEMVEDVEIMAKKAGVELPKDKKKEKKEVKEAIEKTSDRPYREYSKQGALQELKKTHKVAKKPTAKGDPYSQAGRRSPRSKRGSNAPPSAEEKKKPPTQRKTKSGQPSVMQNVTNEANRKMADAFYELSAYVRKGDSVQKGLAYTKASKSIREAPKPIKSKQDAQKLVGVGKSVGDKIEEFIKTGHIKVLDEYKSGERGQ